MESEADLEAAATVIQSKITMQKKKNAKKNACALRARDKIGDKIKTGPHFRPVNKTIRIRMSHTELAT